MQASGSEAGDAGDEGNNAFEGLLLLASTSQPSDSDEGDEGLGPAPVQQPTPPVQPAQPTYQMVFPKDIPRADESDDDDDDKPPAEPAPTPSCRHCHPESDVPGLATYARRAMELCHGRTLVQIIAGIESRTFTLPCVSMACPGCRRISVLAPLGVKTDEQRLAHYMNLVAWAHNFYGAELGSLPCVSDDEG